VAPIRPTMAEVARWRQGAYRLLALLAGYPREDRLALLPEGARLLREAGPWLDRFAFFPAWQALLDRLASLTPEVAPGVQAEFTDLFGPSSTRRPIPLTEMGYLETEGEVLAEALADLHRTLKRAGLTPRPGQSPEHLAVQMEALSYLCGQEAEACEQGEPEKALKWLRLQAQLLRRHAGRWTPLLARAVRRRRPGGFYATVVDALEALVLHDADFTAELLAWSREGDGDEHEEAPPLPL